MLLSLFSNEINQFNRKYLEHKKPCCLIRLVIGKTIESFQLTSDKISEG